MSNTAHLSESGVLLVDKPEGWTSHDAVNCLRRRFRLKKVGHCGTLDPLATGLLVLVIGRATKLSSRFINDDKVYSGVIRLGVETSSQDRDGEITRRHEISDVSEKYVQEAVAGFLGEQKQIPPMVSAIKVNGQKLYKLARKGREIEREPRLVHIYDFTMESIQLPDIRFRVHCSKGTYIRTLAADLGNILGCGGHLHQLRRLRSGSFEVSDAVPMEKIKQWEREDLFEAMTPLSSSLLER